MITSALFAVSAVIVAPPAANAVCVDGVNGACADGGGTPAAAAVAGGPPIIDDAGSGESPLPPAGAPPPSALPVSIARSVCATRAASAFLR